MPIAASGVVDRPRRVTLPGRWSWGAPRTLRGQLALALCCLAGVAVSAGSAGVLALRAASASASDLAQQRLVRMKRAQDLLRHALSIERDTERLMASASQDDLRSSATALEHGATRLDDTVQALAASDDHASVLDLYQSSQLLLGTAQIVVQLRSNVLQAESEFDAATDRQMRAALTTGRGADIRAATLYRLSLARTREAVLGARGPARRTGGPERALDGLVAMRLRLVERLDALGRFHRQLTAQTRALVAAARRQSAVFDADYRDAVQQMVRHSRRDETLVLGLLVCILGATAAVSTLLSRHVLRRLQVVSEHLQRPGHPTSLVEAQVGGQDEIAAMARAVDRFLADRQQLALRTVELQDTQSRLVGSARLAGMAEIATNILHNVGNVLNSVNVSTGLMATQIKGSRLAGLQKVVALLDDHATDLADFLVRDPKGRLLPAYLREVAAALQSEQQRLIDELGTLDLSVGHIKQIVAIQQSYAGAPRVVESLRIDDLIDDALRLCADVIARHRVRVERVPGPPGPLALDRNRVLQILVNLTTNAAQAMAGVDDRPRTMTIAAEPDQAPEGPHLRLSVRDAGEGIAPEHLPRLFVHGFTTRHDGHGFGLHSCALAAQEMGGTMTAVSDGPGQGACFVLDLPLGKKEDAR